MPNRIDLTDVVFNGDPYGDFDRGEGSFDPNSLSSSTNTPTDSENLITKERGNWVVKTFSKVWDYIKGKLGISSSGSASKYLNEQGTFTTIPEIDEDTTPATIPYTPAITVDNALGVNAEDVKVKIEPVQDLHGYDKPWVGGAGKNLFGGTYNTVFPLHFSEDKTVTASCAPVTSDNYANIRFYDENLQIIDWWGLNHASPRDSRTFTLPSTAYYVMFAGRESTDYQLEIGSSATSYEPYSNICPITGWDEVNVTRSGKNLLPNSATSQTINGVAFTVSGDGTIKANGTASQHAQLIIGTFDFKANTQYKLAGCPTGGGYPKFALFVNGTGSLSQQVDVGNGVVFTFEQDVTIEIRIIVYEGYTATNALFKPILSMDTSITYNTFEPYQGNTYTIDLNGTRYGGTLDVTSGELTVDRGIVDLGDLNWEYATSSASGKRYFKSSGQLGGKINTLSEMTSVGYTPVRASDIGITNFSIAFATVNSVYIRDDNYENADADTFKAAMDGVQLVYELAIPQTIQLIPTQIKMLQGNNTLFADSGDSQLSYYVNTLGNIGGALDTLDAGVVKDVSINGNNLRVNKNNTNTDLIIPYATNVGNAIKQGDWWSSGTTHDADDVRDEVVFAYNQTSQANVPANGTLVGFSCKTSLGKNYPFQLHSSYGSDDLRYRRRNGDNNTWGDWRRIIHSGNIGSQSVANANQLNDYYSSRPTSANVQFGDGKLRQFKATSTMTESKPASDGHIIHSAWDNAGGWDAELFIPTNSDIDGKVMQYRSQNSGTWGAWKTLIDSGNIGSQTVSKATTALLKQQNNSDGIIKQVNGEGKYTWYKIATIKINEAYANYPISFELNGRGFGLHQVIVMFDSTNTTDPGLIFLRCDIDIPDNYYIRKSTTSTWELYGKLVETWGNANLIKIYHGSTASKFTITVNMEGVSSLPSGGKYAKWQPRDIPRWYSTNGGSASNRITVNSSYVYTDVTPSLQVHFGYGLVIIVLDSLHVKNMTNTGQNYLVLSGLPTGYFGLPATFTVTDDKTKKAVSGHITQDGKLYIDTAWGALASETFLKGQIIYFMLPED